MQPRISQEDRHNFAALKLKIWEHVIKTDREFMDQCKEVAKNVKGVGNDKRAESLIE